MPIIAIVTQPTLDSINAVYRPIVFRVQATRTDDDPIPPVVYCDIYIDGIFYRTIAKTHYQFLNVGFNSIWEFDIQNALQEYLEKYIGVNGGEDILTVPEVITEAYCRFRSSGFDTDGFLVPEGTAPIQGTDDVLPSPGTGFLSNVIYGVNVTLQHQDNQDLTAHLAAYRYRTWAADSYPLTHRPDRYKICKEDSDYYPIISPREPVKLVLHYKVDGIWYTSDYNAPCAPANFVGFDLTDEVGVGVPLNYSKDFTGTAPFTLEIVAKPAWMSISIVGHTILFTGTPAIGDVGVGIPVHVIIHNCSGLGNVGLDTTIDVVACAAPAFVTLPVSFGTVTEGDPYDILIPFSGTAPVTIDAGTLNIPAWMTAAISGSSLHLFGTPDTPGVIPIFIKLVNSCGFVNLDQNMIVHLGDHKYLDEDEYSGSAVITDTCTATITIHRSVDARDEAVTDNKTVKVNYHIIANNGCEADLFLFMDPADLNKAGLAVDLICGTGPCSSAVITITSIELA